MGTYDGTNRDLALIIHCFDAPTAVTVAKTIGKIDVQNAHEEDEIEKYDRRLLARVHQPSVG